MVYETKMSRKIRALKTGICIFCLFPQLLVAQPNILSPEDIQFVPTPTPTPPTVEDECTVTKLDFITYTRAEWANRAQGTNDPANSIFIPARPVNSCLSNLISTTRNICGEGNVGSSASGEVPRDPIFENFIFKIFSYFLKINILC